MEAKIFNALGQVTGTMSGAEEIIRMNVPTGGRFEWMKPGEAPPQPKLPPEVQRIGARWSIQQSAEAARVSYLGSPAQTHVYKMKADAAALIKIGQVHPILQQEADFRGISPEEMADIYREQEQNADSALIAIEMLRYQFLSQLDNCHDNHLEDEIQRWRDAFKALEKK